MVVAGKSSLVGLHGLCKCVGSKGSSLGVCGKSLAQGRAFSKRTEEVIEWRGSRCGEGELALLTLGRRPVRVVAALNERDW